jgi:small-conductance mechanosensitive channel
MSLFVNASEQDAFLLITDYFASKSMKIVTSSPPSYIRAEFGSWTSISLDNAKGEVEVEITKRNSGSYTNLNFSFFKEYLFALIIAIFATLLLCVTMWWRATRDMSHVAPAEVGNSLFRISLITVGLSAVMFLVAIGLIGYSTSLTRRRFVEEFNMFIQSLPFQKS